MKRSIYIIGYCCIALGLASCSKDEQEFVKDVPIKGLQYLEFTAAAGVDTRMQLVEGNKVEWQSGDAISVFDGTSNRLFTTKDSGPTAVFTGQAAKASTYYALYPYQQEVTIEGNVLKNVALPSIQTAKAGSFDAEFNLSVASSSAESMLFAFKNVGALVKFSVSNDKASEVKSIKLTSHDASAVLAGTADITISDQPTAVVKSGQQSVITLNAPNGLEAGKDYYFSVLPGTLSKGFTLTFVNSEGKTWQKSRDASITAERSGIISMKAVEIGTFTKALLTNANLIAAAEQSTGLMFEKNADGSVSLLNTSNLQIANAVTNLDLSGKNDPNICDEIGLFANLEWLDCSRNGITDLDLSNNLKLVAVFCDGNEAEGIRSYNKRGCWRSNVDGTLETINVGKNALLRYLTISNNRVSSLDISNNKELEFLSCYNNNLISLDVSANVKLKGLSCQSNYLTSLNVSNNKELTSLVCSGGNDIESLDLRNNTKLKSIYCGGNAFTSLDVSNCPDLNLLFCDWSLLTEIDLSYNKELQTFDCYNSGIRTLDLSNNTKLLVLFCGSCQLSDLNVSNNLKLRELECYGNKLTTLDLSNNTNLNYLFCFENQLTTLDITNTNLNLGCGVGSQKDDKGNNLMLTLYVNSEQSNQELTHDGWPWNTPYVDDVNANVNVLLKSEATHEDYTESNYGG